jgi:glycosyltransferase involved in cell wall biosynthesis
MTARGLSYVIPAYNEENAIASTVERLRSVLSTLDIPSEIIVVNDGSRDDTCARAEACGDDIRVINHPINLGYGNAIKTGIKAARHEWIGIVDADGTYDIEELPRLVEKMRNGFDMVVAARKNVLAMDKPLKRFFRRLLIGFLNLVIGARIEDPNSGFRIFTKRLALTFFPFLCGTFSFTTSITVFALGERFFVAYIPLQYAARTGDSKVRHVRDSLRMLQLVLQGITFFNPVKFYLMLVAGLVAMFLVPSIVLSLLGCPTVALYWFLTGAIACLLMGMGVLGDIVRISSISRDTGTD